jgi:hypothetical protein
LIGSIAESALRVSHTSGRYASQLEIALERGSDAQGKRFGSLESAKCGRNELRRRTHLTSA